MHIILYNPLSKNKKAKRTTKKVVEYFKKNHMPFRLKSLLKIKNIESYLKKTPKDVKILLLGGDGTINTFINHTVDLAVENEVYLKGNGSGNDFLRSLKKQRPLTQPIMLMRYNDKKRYFINGAGIGMDGRIAHLVNQSVRKNRFNYFFNALRTFATFKPRYAEVIIDGELYTFNKAYLVNMNSGQFIGGGMRLTPDAILSEDELDIIVVHKISKPLLFIVFLSVYLGFHKKLKRYIFYKKGKHIKATMFSNQVVQCDGETFENAGEIEVTTTNKHANFKSFELEKNTN